MEREMEWRTNRSRPLPMKETMVKERWLGGRITQLTATDGTGEAT